MFASGRWWPQPLEMNGPFSSKATLQPVVLNDVEEPNGSVVDVPQSTAGSALDLPKESAAPLYAKPRTTGKAVYKTERGKGGELLADYVLFEDSMKRVKVPWKNYDGLTSEERDIYMTHLKAVEEKKLKYRDPSTGYTVMTVSQFHELSRHRTRPPNPGIHRRTRCVVVDNSALGKEANNSGKLAYCIHVYKQGARKKHMPHATLGDKILVAIRGEMKKAFVVGANTHVTHRKHGVPSTDTNNIVLLDDEGNPLGNRIIAPIPAKLLDRRDNVQMMKVLDLATKYI
ncbi:hypothetical protein QR680_015208 [Steinernema hermaphroditum]|uniref:Large ribosomal subunit protein uL14m n=1 Tax=Steinernema hermaphroditum TaxID=289476 RepID=A0AA39M567_9BILA|nr:hypothetical protein QR680_015208 [Steinernema hermaphroditum]